MELVFTLNNIQEAAGIFLKITAGHQVIALQGEMGSGKTTFIHALCIELGVNDTVTSPTFSIINQYKRADGPTVYHMDLFRIKDEQEAINAGIEDCLYSGNICLVEWPEKIPAIFPSETLYTTITAVDTNTRKLKINL